MSRVSPDPPGRGGVARLDRLAAGAARDLGANGVVVTEQTAEGPSRIVAVAGVTRRRADYILWALVEREQALERVGPPAARAAGEGAAVLDAVGSITTVPAEVDGRRVGTVHVISPAGRTHSEATLRAYTAHLAVGIAASSSRRGGIWPVPMSLVNALGELALESKSWSELIHALEAALAEEFGKGKIGLMLWQSESDALQMTPGSFGADRGTAAAYRMTVSNSQSNAARVMATGFPYLSNSALGDAGILQEYVHAFGIERLMSVPLTVGDQGVGVMHLANKDDDYALEDLWRLQALTPHLARAILTFDLLFALRRRKQLEGMLSQVAVAIASGRSMHQFLPRALEKFTVATDADLVALVAGDAAPIVWRAQSITPEMEEAVLAAARRHPDFVSATSGPHSAGDAGSTTLHIPVHLGTLRVGTLSSLRCRAEPFTSDERDAFKRLAKQTALAWATERYQQQRADVARVEERNRIADDLHDDVAQILFAAHLSLETALETPDLGPDLGKLLGEVRGRIAMAGEALRNAIHQLSRHDEQSLCSQLFSVVHEVEQDFGIPIHLEIAEQAELVSGGLSRTGREALLRVARESLVNAAKHAGPCRVGVTVNVNRRGQLTMRISDDGIGIGAPTAAAGHGIASLRRVVRRHGGTLYLRSGPTGGTTLHVTVPL